MTEAHMPLGAPAAAPRVDGLVVERREQRSSSGVVGVRHRVHLTAAAAGMTKGRAVPAALGPLRARAREEPGIGREDVERQPAARDQRGARPSEERQELGVRDEVLDAPVKRDETPARKRGFGFRGGPAEIGAHEQTARRRAAAGKRARRAAAPASMAGA